MSKKYTFREITKEDELDKLFRLRYKVYSDCRWSCILKNSKSQIDIDFFDVHSKHYVLKCENTDVGYLRVVLPRTEICQEDILKLAKKYNLFNGNYHSNDNSIPYPFLSYNDTPKSYWGFYKSSSDRHEKFIEASRLVLIPEYRTIRSSIFLIECAMVYYTLVCQEMNYAIITCTENHSSFYKHYGFSEIDSILRYQFTDYKATALVQELSLSSFPGKYHTKFQDMADEFTLQQKIERTF